MELERAQRLVRLRSWGLCEGCGQMDGLFAAAHHRQARGMGGVHRLAASAANDPRNMLRLCGTCHDETEHAETWDLTEGLGWRIPKHIIEPYAVPALIYTVNGYGWWLLTQEGDYLWVDPVSPPTVPQATWLRQAEDPLVLAASPGTVSANRLRMSFSA